MAYFLIQVAYTPEGMSTLINNPQDRSAAIRGAVEKLGGQFERFWLAFGDYDVVGVLQMPDNVSAAAFAMAVSAGGACKAVKTTPLLTVEEGIEAMRKAAASGYKPAAAGGR
jgi:uncharacterized protein with GYD domain